MPTRTHLPPMAGLCHRVSRPARTLPFGWIAGLACILPVAAGAHAADIFKADNTTSMRLGGSWEGGVPPTDQDIAVFSGVYQQGGNLGTGEPLTYWGMRVTDDAGPTITINNTTAANHVELLGGGLDMSDAVRDLIIRSVFVGADQTWDINTGATFTVGGTKLAGSGSVTKQGGGTVVITAASIHSGTMIINDGTLELSGNSATLASAVTVHGGTLAAVNGTPSLNGPITLAGPAATVNASSNLNITGSIDGGGTLTKIGGGTLALTGAGTYTGDTVISDGVLDLTGGQIYAGNATYDQTVTVTSGGVLLVGNFGRGTGGAPSLGNLNTAAANVVLDGGTLQVDDSAARGRAVTIASGGGTIQVLAGVSYTMSNPGNPNSYADNSAFTLTGGGTGQIDKAIFGDGVSVVKAGNGTWALMAQNTYTGGTIAGTGTSNTSSDPGETSASGGFLVVGHDQALGTGTVAMRGAQVRAAMPDITIANDIVVEGGGFRFGGSYDLTFTGTTTLVGGNRGIGNYSGDRTLTLGDIDTNGNRVQFHAIPGADNNGTTRVDGAITGTGNVRVEGTFVNGTVILTGTNTYTGPTTVGAGTLLLTHTGAAAGYDTSGRITVESGATYAVRAGGAGEWTVADIDTLLGNATFQAGSLLGIEVIGADPFTHPGPIGGVQGLATLGPGTLVLSGANNYTGGTRAGYGTSNTSSDPGETSAAGGFLVLGHDQALGTSTVTMRGAQVRAAMPGITIANDVVIEGGGFRFGGSHDLTFTGATTLVGGNRSIGNYSGDRTLTLGDIDNNGNRVEFVGIGGAAQNGITMVEGVISGSGVVRVQPSFDNGTVIFAGANTYTGNTPINGGQLVLAHPLAAQNSTVSINTAGGLAFDSGTSFTLGGLAGDHDLSLLNAAAQPVALAVGNHGGDTTYDGVLSGAGGSLTKIGAGMLTLTRDNTYTGGTVLNEGTLRADHVRAFGPAGSTVTLNGGTLQLNGGGADANHVYDLEVLGNAGLQAIGNRKDVIGSITGDGTLNVVGSQGLRMAVDMSGFAGTLVKDNSGELHLMIDNGTFGDTATTSGSAGAAFVVNTGRVYLLNNNQAGTAYMGALSGSGGTINSKFSRSGDVTLEVGALGLDTTFGGVIDDGNTGPTRTSLTKVGAGTLTLTGNNTFSGATTISGGTLLVAGQMRNTASLTVHAGATLETGATNIFLPNHGTAMPDSRVITVDGGTWLMNANMDSRFGNVTLRNGATWTSDRGLGAWDALLANTTAGPATVTVSNTGGNTSPSTMNGSGGLHLQGVQNFNVANVTGTPEADLIVSMILDGPGNAGGAAGGIHKLGDGTMLLSAANTYTGTTTVNGGTLLVNNTAGSGTGSGPVTVNSGGTLGGTGAIGGPVTVNTGGWLSPGMSTGVLTMNSLALEPGSTTLMEIDGLERGDEYDGVDIAAASGLAYGGTLSLAFGNTSPFADGTVFNLFDFTGTASDGFDDVVSTGFYAGDALAWQYDNNDMFSLKLGPQTLLFSHATGDLTIIPEPAAWLLLLSALACGLLLRRRR